MFSFYFPSKNNHILLFWQISRKKSDTKDCFFIITYTTKLFRWAAVGHEDQTASKSIINMRNLLFFIVWIQPGESLMDKKLFC